jgi:carboxymethylenebutenolidase
MKPNAIALSACLAAALALCAAPTLARSSAGSDASGQARLDASPRHHEWVDVPVPSDGGTTRTVLSFVAHPERSESATAVIVIHENRGLTDWVRTVADRLAEAGYLAIAPDLLSGFDAEHGRTADFASSDAARDALYQLDPDQVTADLMAVQEYVAGLPSANGRVAVMGFCWGGSRTFRLATDATGLAAALVFYGSPPSEESEIEAITAPVHGFYGENDQRINATIPDTKKLMAKHGKTYEVEIYDGVGHAFMRRADDPDAPAEYHEARDAAWKRVLRILSGIG